MTLGIQSKKWSRCNDFEKCKISSDHPTQPRMPLKRQFACAQGDLSDTVRKKVLEWIKSQVCIGTYLAFSSIPSLHACGADQKIPMYTCAINNPAINIEMSGLYKVLLVCHRYCIFSRLSERRPCLCDANCCFNRLPQASHLSSTCTTNIPFSNLFPLKKSTYCACPANLECQSYFFSGIGFLVIELCRIRDVDQGVQIGIDTPIDIHDADAQDLWGALN